jgi:hypothetical protein
MSGAYKIKVSTRDLDWLAGLLEGEGCFGAYPQKSRLGPRLIIELGMTDKDVVERAANILGSSVYAQQKSKSMGPNTKTYYRARVKHRRAAAWMKMLYPLMGKRRKDKIQKALQIWEEYIPVTRQEAGHRAAAARWPKYRMFLDSQKELNDVRGLL